MRLPQGPKPGDTVVRRPRDAELEPVSVQVEPRSVSVRGPTSPMVLIYGFLGVIFIGTVLLALPISITDNSGLGLSDRITRSLFTATSAAAVTGLVVAETDVVWTRFGQAVIMALFFIGGLGFMTGAAFLLMIVGQRLGLQGQLLLRAGLDGAQLGAITALVRRIVLFSVITQLIGSTVLFLRWYVFGSLWEGISAPDALWQSTFHAVSAFNNAGFEIMPNLLVGGSSLEPFKSDIPLLLIMGLLILTGGLSYFVLADVVTTRRFGKLRLDSKLVLIGTGVIIFLGASVFLWSEWEEPATIGNQSVVNKMANATFHSAAARTAGFSTVGYGEITPANSNFTQALMFIGGASASAAGGIKINTVMVIMLMVAATLRGKSRVNAFGREVPRPIIQRAMIVGGSATLMLLLLLAVLLAIQPELGFTQAAFEMVSAFGTVGLSTGITSELNPGARVVVSIAMFIGRFGPLTLVLLMAGRSTVESYQYASERVRIG